MRFYLIRHAEAESGEQLDPTRTLTEVGKKQIPIIGDFLKTQTGKIGAVMHSDMKRGIDTAEPLADILDVPTIQDPAVGPGGTVPVAWKHITKAAAKLEPGEELCIVSHGPLINSLSAWLLMSGEGDKFHFSHGSVAHFDTETPENGTYGYDGRQEGQPAYMHWLVTPKLLNRYQEEDRKAVIESMDAAAQVAQSCLGIVESLNHPRHAAALAPLRAKLAKVLTRRWKKQGTALLKKSAGWLKSTAAMKEADPAMKRKVTAHLNASLVFDRDPDSKDVSAYDAVVAETIAAGAERMRSDFAISLEKDQGKAAVSAHLKDRGFAKLVKDVDATSKERLANALTDVFDSGGTYQDAVKAIKDTVASFTDDRADMIARTELADAYNQAMLTSARESGDLLKTWEPDGEACEEICTPNVDQGPIDVDEDFESGDDAPPGHPRCDCSLGFVKAGA